MSQPSYAAPVLSRSIARILVLATTVLFGGAFFQGIRLPAQRGPVQRIVQGKVTDKSEKPIGGAVVYLKDDHSLAVKSFISEADGAYRFGQLADGTDYELWAESTGKKSPTKSISSFDTKTSFQINLKIDTSK